jgi:hypothetical protein
LVPIFEQGKGQGIGYENVKSFTSRFEKICEEHKTKSLAKSFAFIFYDFHDEALRRIIRDVGVFAQLDRLAGKELSIFYLHSSTERAVQKFNKSISSSLGLDKNMELPCIVFFKLSDSGFTDIIVANLDNTNLIHGFREIYVAVEKYLSNNGEVSKSDLKFIRWIKSSTKFVTFEVLRNSIRLAMGHLPI